jgi:hypothetical protein
LPFIDRAQAIASRASFLKDSCSDSLKRTKADERAGFRLGESFESVAGCDPEGCLEVAKAFAEFSEKQFTEAESGTVWFARQPRRRHRVSLRPVFTTGFCCDYLLLI